MSYNFETLSYDCDKCGSEMIYDGIKYGLCSNCWLEECKKEYEVGTEKI